MYSLNLFPFIGISDATVSYELPYSVKYTFTEIISYSGRVNDAVESSIDVYVVNWYSTPLTTILFSKYP